MNAPSDDLDGLGRLRLGLLGSLINFVSHGSVGGDLFRAMIIAREQPDFRAEAVAAVVMDHILDDWRPAASAAAG